jgi:hypothetical protein
MMPDFVSTRSSIREPMLLATDPPEFAAAHPPTPAELDALLERLRSRPCSGGGQPIRFVAAAKERTDYEAAIYRRGEIATRHNWHDAYNALAWLRFPLTKAALNKLHVEAPPRAGGRGALRDAATQFDESGIVVLAADSTLIELLEARRWKTLFWEYRRDVVAAMRFLVFGHGLAEALRAPFYRMCGRAACIVVPQTLIAASQEEQCAHADRVLAERFVAKSWYPRPKALLALPVLGIPGVCAENEDAAYYDDTLQFRPPPDR